MIPRGLGPELLNGFTCAQVQDIAMATFLAEAGLPPGSAIPKNLHARNGTWSRCLVIAALTYQAAFACYCDTCMRVRQERRRG